MEGSDLVRDKQYSFSSIKENDSDKLYANSSNSLCSRNSLKPTKPSPAAQTSQDLSSSADSSNTSQPITISDRPISNWGPLETSNVQNIDEYFLILHLITVINDDNASSIPQDMSVGSILVSFYSQFEDLFSIKKSKLFKVNS